MLNILFGYEKRSASAVPRILFYGEKRSQLVAAMNRATSPFLGVIEMAQPRFKSNLRAEENRAANEARSAAFLAGGGASVIDPQDSPLELANEAEDQFCEAFLARENAIVHARLKEELKRFRATRVG